MDLLWLRAMLAATSAAVGSGLEMTLFSARVSALGKRQTAASLRVAFQIGLRPSGIRM
jgi:hypothetical protein